MTAGGRKVYRTIKHTRKQMNEWDDIKLLDKEPRNFENNKVSDNCTSNCTIEWWNEQTSDQKPRWSKDALTSSLRRWFAMANIQNRKQAKQGESLLRQRKEGRKEGSREEKSKIQEEGQMKDSQPKQGSGTLLKDSSDFRKPFENFWKHGQEQERWSAFSQ